MNILIIVSKNTYMVTFKIIRISPYVRKDVKHIISLLVLINEIPFNNSGIPLLYKMLNDIKK